MDKILHHGLPLFFFIFHFFLHYRIGDDLRYACYGFGVRLNSCHTVYSVILFCSYTALIILASFTFYLISTVSYLTKDHTLVWSSSSQEPLSTGVAKLLYTVYLIDLLLWYMIDHGEIIFIINSVKKIIIAQH